MSQHAISVIEETLDVTLPSERVSVLAVQPFLQFRDPVQEPFLLSQECESRLLRGLQCVLDTAKQRSPQFIVVPEFSVPGTEGVRRVITAFQEATILSSTIFIGGVTSLSVDQFASLSGLDDVDIRIADANQPIHIPTDAWVNTSVTIAKCNDNSIRMWVQPKVSPSWPESQSVHQRMFKGQALHLFKAVFEDGLPCHFFTALCYDWIGREYGTTAPHVVLQQFNGTCLAKQSPQHLNWVFARIGPALLPCCLMIL